MEQEKNELFESKNEEFIEKTLKIQSVSSYVDYEPKKSNNLQLEIKEIKEYTPTSFLNNKIEKSIKLPQQFKNPETQTNYHENQINELRKMLLNKTKLYLKGRDPEDPLVKNFPQIIDKYHSFYPLENLNKNNISKVYSIVTTVYKATDGIKNFAIRKIDNNNIKINQIYDPIVNIWKHLSHPNIAELNDIFVSSTFTNIPSIFMVYEYYPDAQTLDEKFPISVLTNYSPQLSKLPSEDFLWSLIIQLVSVLNFIHSKGLSAVNLLQPSKILVIGNRIRLNSCGLDDLLNYQRNISNQQEDIINLGKICFRLTFPPLDYSYVEIKKSLDKIASNFTAEFHSFILRLTGFITNSFSNSYINYPTVDELQYLLSFKAFNYLDQAHIYQDTLENELAKEIDNGRLFHLLLKLGFINERPDFELIPSWSETGDRYPLKLFRDYLFHQVDQDGKPLLDISRIIESLNKIDFGVEERVPLASRDQKNLLIFTYADLKEYLNQSFKQLIVASKTNQ